MTLATTGDTAAAMFIQAWPLRGAVADLAVVERARPVAGVSYPGGAR